MGTSPVDSWQPKFPEPQPRHWVCFTALPDEVSILSDRPLGSDEREWLRRWLEAHIPREADAEASYVYLGMATDWVSAPPNGRVSPDAVIGVGSGSDFGEPPGAVASTVGRIWDGAIEELSAEAT
jgi:hypothetical protein